MSSQVQRPGHLRDSKCPDSGYPKIRLADHLGGRVAVRSGTAVEKGLGALKFSAVYGGAFRYMKRTVEWAFLGAKRRNP
jgi:hypothetical protein